ncbi:MAG: FKBP-type peptidyl-prolyl cis-trans isomerase [Cellulomonas sp.]|nr:FKBP-type peptidyl-prolyl cis-trans isomerase [Cellulomonas sp.]
MRFLVRRAAPLAVLVLTAALGLAACSSDSSASPSASASASSTSASTSDPQDIAVLEGVTVTGDLGTEPTITLPSSPFNVSGFATVLVEDGTGAAITSGQIVQMQEVAVSGVDGSILGSTWSSGAQTLTAGSNDTLGNFDEVLLSAHVGARILVAYPSSTATSTSSAETDVIAIDILDAYSVPARASGEAVTPAAGLPTVTLSDTGEPTLTPVTTDAPTTLVIQPLIKGTGAAVTAGQVVTVNYSGWLWDGTAFDSSWTNGTSATFTLDTDSVITGWVNGLVGQTVGSQVLLIIPPDQGYGDTEQGTIPASSTLVFVVDILDAR